MLYGSLVNCLLVGTLNHYSRKGLTDPDCHPITLTSCLCKVMKRMVHNRLLWYLEKKLIIPAQCSFRKQRSVTDHLIHLESFVRAAFIQQQHPVAVFFDLEQVAQLSPRDCAAGWVSYGQKWKTELGDNIYKHYRSIFNHCDVIGQHHHHHHVRVAGDHIFFLLLHFLHLFWQYSLI